MNLLHWRKTHFSSSTINLYVAHLGSLYLTTEELASQPLTTIAWSTILISNRSENGYSWFVIDENHRSEDFGDHPKYGFRTLRAAKDYAQRKAELTLTEYLDLLEVEETETEETDLWQWFQDLASDSDDDRDWTTAPLAILDCI